MAFTQTIGEEPAIQLGDVAQDNLTGFVGTVVARTEWLDGRWLLVLQTEHGSNGKTVEAQSFNAKRVSLVRAKGRLTPPTPRPGLGG